MLNIFISLLTFVLILVSLFMVLVILMQRANSNAGMGSAFGGGVTESAFGAETTNILTRATKWSALAFFGISLALYLMYMSREGFGTGTGDSAPPEIPVVSEETVPVPETGTFPIPDENGEALPSAEGETVPAGEGESEPNP
ncbi:MAG TPA: preprotein translocase subunit SecG [Oceanipulchritudo sp.]|nr:preprotein translocase subunit SecG [Oceanipulchritudo sp.]